MVLSASESGLVLVLGLVTEFLGMKCWASVDVSAFFVSIGRL